MENKSLGKGLSALIPQSKMAELRSGNKIPSESKTDEGIISSLDINKINYNRFQPRQNYDKSKLEELKASIKEKGVLQPILVRPAGDRYEVVAGERRLRAAKALGMTQVPVVVKNVTDREALVLALVENIQRQELNPIEEAKGYKRLIEEFQFTQETVAESVGKDRSTVTNLLRLLKLPEEIQEDVAQEKLSAGHARALLSIEDMFLQKKMAREAIAQRLSVRQVEDRVKKFLESPGEGKKSKNKKPRNRDIEILEEELSRILGTKVLVESRSNKGKVVIEYYSLDDLDRILGVIRR